jgi:quercetin dioxygenase-like cupin family protein
MGVETVWKVGSVSTGASQVTLATGTLPPGHETPTHLHEIDEEVIYVLSGELTAILEGEEHTAGPGATVFIPPGSWMAIANRTEAPVVMVAVITRDEAEECFRVLFSRDADEEARREAEALCRIRHR